MSILRRIALIVFGLLFMTIITIALLVPQALRSIANNVDGFATPVRLVIVIIVDIIILALIYSLIRHRRVVNKGGLVVKSGGGNVLADVSPESARERILKVIRDVPAVVSAEAKLDAIDGKADIDMDVVVDGDDLSVPDKHKEIDRALRQVVIKQLGLQLASRPRVHIRLVGPGEALPVTEPVPVLPAVAPAPILPPPEPIAPVASVVAPSIASTPAIGVDPSAVPDAEVSSQYGLIGRRTDQYKAVPVTPSAPAVEPEPVATPEPEFRSSWQVNDAAPLPSEPAPVATPEPEYTGSWLRDDATPLPTESAFAPVINPEPEFLGGWATSLPTDAPSVADPEPEAPTGFLRRWRTGEPVTPAAVEPSTTTDEDDIDVDRVDDDAADVDPIKVGKVEIDPIGQELEALDASADSVEDKGNVRIYSRSEPDFSDATLITPIPTVPSSFADDSDDDSTAAPPAVLYDDTGDDEPESDDADTLSKFP